MEDKTLMIKSYFFLLRKYIKFCIVKDMQYRLDFLSHIITDLIFCILKISFVEIYFMNINELCGYSKYEVIFIFGTSFIAIAFYMIFCFFSHVSIPKDIRTGYVDLLLIKPISPFFLLSFRIFNIGGVGGLLFGIFLVIYSSNRIGLELVGAKLIIYIILLLCGSIIYFSLSFFLFIWSFWTQAAQGFIGIITDMGEAMKYPIDIYPKGIQIVFSFCFPLLMIAAYPAGIVIGKINYSYIAVNILISFISLFAVSMFLHFAISKYQSASS